MRKRLLARGDGGYGRGSSIGAGPAAFDIGDAAIVELFDDAQFVLEREGHVLGLAAVA
jgi:hypothetical protein